MPEKQKAIVELVKQLSEKFGFELKVIDVAKENIIQRLWIEMKDIKNLHIAEINQGDRLHSPFSRNELENFISKEFFH